MSSAVKADKLEAALAAAIGRFDGTSPVTAQVHASLDHGAERCPERLFMQLVLEVAAEEGASADDVLDVACAVEILHRSTLVHASVEDPQQARFGLAHGINAGDALCALAYLQLLDGRSRRRPEQTVVMTRALQEANFLLCAGQAQELAFARDEAFGDEAYLAMLAGTSALFAAACELGAYAAGATPERARAYGQLGRAYATAFHMRAHLAGVAAPRWALPAAASAAAAAGFIDAGDRLAATAGIDTSNRVRAFFTAAIRTAA